jgi:hypothetical protein
MKNRQNKAKAGKVSQKQSKIRQNILNKNKANKVKK